MYTIILASSALVRHEKVVPPQTVPAVPIEFFLLLMACATVLAFVAVRKLRPESRRVKKEVREDLREEMHPPEDPRERIIYYYNSAARILGLMEKSKTHLELLNALDDRRSSFEILTRLFELAKYSGYEVGEVECEEARRAYEDILRSL